MEHGYIVIWQVLSIGLAKIFNSIHHDNFVHCNFALSKSMKIPNFLIYGIVLMVAIIMCF